MRFTETVLEAYTHYVKSGVFFAPNYKSYVVIWHVTVKKIARAPRGRKGHKLTDLAGTE